jgi:hypothetical protein
MRNFFKLMTMVDAAVRAKASTAHFPEEAVDE